MEIESIEHCRVGSTSRIPDRRPRR